MTLAAGTCLGPYEIIALIGAGGMGEVYRARDTRLDRTVAIKVAREHFNDSTTASSCTTTPRLCILPMTLHNHDDAGADSAARGSGSPPGGLGGEAARVKG